MQSIRFRDLGSLSPEAALPAFIEAFSDYPVPVRPSLEDFDAMQRRRGVSYAASLGAFEGERLVGFIFNGTGSRGGVPCAYDAGTGVVPSHRGRGLSKALAAETETLLRGLGFQAWLLEVLVENARAAGVYEAAGFRRTRRLRCLSGPAFGAGRGEALAAARAALMAAEARGLAVVEPAGPLDEPRAWRDWEPTWQNSDESLARTPERLVTLVAERRSGSAREAVGFLASTSTGSVAQLVVRPDARRDGVGTALLAALAAKVLAAREEPDGPTAPFRYVNVQADDEASLRLLEAVGLTEARDQWEMLRELR